MGRTGISSRTRRRLSRAADETLKALDEVLKDPTPEHIESLRSACDRLMRVAARIILTSAPHDDSQ